MSIDEADSVLTRVVDRRAYLDELRRIERLTQQTVDSWASMVADAALAGHLDLASDYAVGRYLEKRQCLALVRVCLELELSGQFRNLRGF